MVESFSFLFVNGLTPRTSRANSEANLDVSAVVLEISDFKLRMVFALSFVAVFAFSKTSFCLSS